MWLVWIKKEEKQFLWRPVAENAGGSYGEHEDNWFDPAQYMFKDENKYVDFASSRGISCIFKLKKHDEGLEAVHESWMVGIKSEQEKISRRENRQFLVPFTAYDGIYIADIVTGICLYAGRRVENICFFTQKSGVYAIP